MGLFVLLLGLTAASRHPRTTDLPKPDEVAAVLQPLLDAKAKQ